MANKRKLTKKDLWYYQSLIDDKSEKSPDYFDIVTLPTIFTAGKNLIRIKANQNTMLVGSTIYVEILDANDEPVYYEILDIIDDDKSRIISVYIYDDTASGDAKFTLLGTAFKDANGNKLDVSSPNVKFTKSIPIQYRSDNESEIIFDNSKQPQINIEEKILPYIETNYTNGKYITDIDSINYNRGTITLNGLTFNEYMLSGSVYLDAVPGFSQPFSSSIVEIYNNKKARIHPEVGTNSPFSTFQTNASFYYKASGSQTTTQHKVSYAYVNISNLQPLTGDVSSIRAFIKNSGEKKDNWDMIDEYRVEPPELLIDTSSLSTPNLKIGNITSQSLVDNYYSVIYHNNNSNVNLVHNINSLFNSIETSYNESIGDNTFSIKINKELYLSSDTSYKINFTSYTVNDENYSSENEMRLYISGSAFKKTNDGENIGLNLLTINKNNGSRYKGDLIITPDEDGYANLLFNVRGGKWFISDISIKPYVDKGFTPNDINITLSIPPKHRFDYADFKFEHINPSGKISKLYSIKNDVFLTGSNYYIYGDDNLVSGSTTVGTELNKGILLSGNSDKGAIKTHQYTNLEDEESGNGNGGINLYSDNSGDMGMEMFSSNGMYGSKFGSNHVYSQRPGFTEMYSNYSSNALNQVPTFGRSIVMYVSTSVGYPIGTLVTLNSNGEITGSGLRQVEVEPEVFEEILIPPNAIALSPTASENYRILLQGVYKDNFFNFEPGKHIYYDGTFLTTNVPVSSSRTIGLALDSNVGYFDFVNSRLNQDGLFSSSQQVDFELISNVPEGLVSSSEQVFYPLISGIPPGIVSSSAQITDLGFSISSSDQILLGNNLISSSDQITDLGFLTESLSYSASANGGLVMTGSEDNQIQMDIHNLLAINKSTIDGYGDAASIVYLPIAITSSVDLHRKITLQTLTNLMTGNFQKKETWATYDITTTPADGSISVDDDYHTLIHLGVLTFNLSAFDTGSFQEGIFHRVVLDCSASGGGTTISDDINDYTTIGTPFILNQGDRAEVRMYKDGENTTYSVHEIFV